MLKKKPWKTPLFFVCSKFLSFRQVSSHHRENRLRQGARSDPLPPVEPAPRWVVSLDLAVPAAAGARHPEETGQKPTGRTAGTAHRLSASVVVVVVDVVVLSQRRSLFLSDSVEGVCAGHEGSGLLDRLSLLPGQNPQRQQRRWDPLSALTPEPAVLFGGEGLEEKKSSCNVTKSDTLPVLIVN